MAFCINCGNKLKENDKFCENCGTPVELTETETMENKPNNPEIIEPMQQTQFYTQQIPYNQQPPVYGYPPQVKKHTKKPLVAAIIASIIVIIGVAGFLILNSIVSKDTVISNFSKAIEQKDVKELSKYLVSSDSRVKVDEASIKAFLDYIDQNPSYLNDIINSFKSGKSSNYFVQNDSSADLKLKTDGKVFLFFNKYVFEMQPYFINVKTDYKDTEIYMDDKEVCKADSDNFSKQIGPYLPGLHKIKAVYKGEYSSLEEEKEIKLVSSVTSGRKANINLSLKGKTITITSVYRDAKVFVNGKDVGRTVEQVNEKGFGPVDSKTKISLQKEFPWGTVKSEEVEVGNNSRIKIDINAVNDTLKNQMMDVVNKFNTQWEEACFIKDSSKVENATPAMLDDINRRIQALKDKRYMYQGTYVKGIYDLDSFSIVFSGQKYTAYLKNHEFLKEVEYPEGQKAPNMQDKDYYWRYELVYDNVGNKWLVDSYTKSYSMNTKNVKEFTF